MSNSLDSYVEKTVQIITTDGRVILGKLKGFDQTTNVILNNSLERVFTPEGVEELPLGLYIVRGDNIMMVCEIDEESDARIEWSLVKAEPLPQMKKHRGFDPY
ncbi:N(alpha)-acetyltransferase 38, NatC auxiliary [Rhizophlyctis rosea]|nr:N(alpha)-acetyltransferase 38, NatC auxiliary [Rhizophlyctis rosea]